MGNEPLINSALPQEHLMALICTFRGEPVMMDSDLARLYGVETKVLNQSVKRNVDRFPGSFRFQLTDAEKKELVTSCDRFRNLKHASAAPYAFTEQGVAMLSAVLRSKTAVRTSISIISAFVGMRRYIVANSGLLQRIDLLEQRQSRHEIWTEEHFDKVFDALEQKSLTPAQGIFFDGQIFDAYVFLNNLLRQARHSVILVDNYVDDSVLTQLTKRRENVKATIFTRTISKQLALDLERHNAQYTPITIRELADSHDRFLILDGVIVYHLGASLKDLGKKWFAFSIMDKAGLKVLEKIESILEIQA